MCQNQFSHRCTLHLICLWLASFLVIACNPGTTVGDRQPDEPITVSGRLGPGLSVASSVARGGTVARSIAGAVSGIASIPVIAGNAGIGPGTEVLPVATDGSFSITLQPGADESALLLLVNENYATLEEKAVGFVSLADPSGVDLSLLPLGNAKRDLEFGYISSDQAGIMSEYSLSEQAPNFSETFATLLETAYRDNLFKNAKNMYVNLDKTSGQWIMERTRCYATGTVSQAENTGMSVEIWDFTPGFNMRIDAFYPAGHSYASLDSGFDDIEIVPPEVINLKTYTPDHPFVFGPESPLLLSVARALPSGHVISFISGNGEIEGDGGYTIEFDGEENLGNGLWQFNLLKGGVRSELALFDVQSADPFTTDAARAFIYYLPSISIITDAASRLLSIAVTWYAWNPAAGEYQALSDFTAFDTLIENYTTGIVSMKTDPDGVNYNDEESTNNQALSVPGRAWYLRSVPADGTRVDWIRINYAISGVEYFFTLYNE